MIADIKIDFSLRRTFPQKLRPPVYVMRIALLSLASLVAIGCSKASRPTAPVARNGALDLSKWDFQTNGPTTLSGDWQLQWGEFVPPRSPLQNAHLARVPRSWDQLQIPGVSGRGFGTFRIVLKGLPETDAGLLITIPSMTGAYRLYCGEDLIATAGIAGNSYQSTRPERIPRVAIVPPDCIHKAGTVLTWHAANFRHRTGGGAAELTSTMSIGLPGAALKSVYWKHLSDLSLLSIAFIMGLYHLVFWLFRRDDIQLVLFSAVASLFCVRIIGTQSLLQQAFPAADFYELEFMFEYLGYYLLIPVFFSYLRAWYPDEFHRFVAYALWTIGGVFSATVLFGPVGFYSRFVSYYEAVSLATFLYTLIALGLAIVRRRRGAWIINVGIWIIIGTATHDILANMGQIHTETYVAQFGFLTFLLSQSSLMAALFSDAFRRAEDLSENLEKKVVSRTEELAREKRRAEQEKAENEVLANLARRANEGADIQDILIQTSRYVASECGVLRLGFYLVDPDKNTLELHSVLENGQMRDLKDAPQTIQSIPIEFENGSLPAVIQRNRKMFVPYIKQQFLDASPVDAAHVKFHQFDWFLHAPLHTGGSIIGIMVFVGPKETRPDLRDRQLMERIVDQVAGAVQSKQLLAEVEESRGDSEALAELARRADEGADLTEIGNLVLHYAREKCGVNTLALYTLNESKERLEVQALARNGLIQPGDTIPEDIRFPSLSEDTGTLHRVVSTGKPLYMARLSDRMKARRKEHDKKIQQYLDFDWFLDIPMVAEGKVIGVIAYAGPARAKLTPGERDFLERTTRQVSGSVQNRQLLKEVESERNVARTLQKETEGLNQLLKRIAPMEDLDEIMAEVIGFSDQTYDIGVYSLYSVDNETKQMYALSMNFPDHIGAEDRQHIMETPIPLDYRGGAFTMAYRRSPRYTYFRTVNPEPLPAIEQFVTEKYNLSNMVVYPLMEGIQVQAFLNFLTYNEEGLNREQLSQLSILSDQISGIIRMNGLIREVKEQSARTEEARKETEALAQLSRKANEATDLEAVSQTLFGYLRESLQLEDFCLFVLEPETMIFHAAAWDTEAANNPETRHWLETTHYTLEPEIGSLYRTYERKKTTYLPRFPEAFFAPGDRAIVEKLKLTSALQVPLIIQDEVIGFFTCGPRRRLTREEIATVERFCNQVAGAIRATALLNSTAQARERAEAAQQETELLADLSKQANETSSLQNLCETLFDHLQEQYGIENQALFVVDNESFELTPAAARGGVGPEERQRWLNTFRINLQRDPGTMSSTYKRQKPFYIKQIPKKLSGKDLEIVQTLNPRSILQVPLVLQGRTVAIMVADPAKELTSADITSIERLCDQIAGAVRTTALLQATQEAREEAVASKEEAEVARAESDALLENVLPRITAKELKESGRVEPVYFDNVSVLFTDFVGFTTAAAKLTPAELIQELDGCFSQFDEVSRRNNMEKLKTIGDAYMCAGGLPVPNDGHAIDACLTALEFSSFMKQMAEVKTQLGFDFWQIRIGIH
ncbi:MAG: GAF domain-containing protein, partial [Leptospiraceae bacterium]|nr:GAF domain-containing protein [Leptospiraceae bacterium]